MNNGEAFAFFYWHRHRYPWALGDTRCYNSSDPASYCRKEWEYKWFF